MVDKELPSSEIPVALTIAGLDPSGGAGILADVRTFADFGCFPAAVITSITFQNTTGVFGVRNQAAEIVREQTKPIISDLKVAALKTGMLPTAEVISEVARLIESGPLPAPVLDPVMRATSGDQLIDDAAIDRLVSELFPLARVVTPNIPEAERLTGLTIDSEARMAEAAKLIRKLGARAVLVKGGHAFWTRLSKEKAGEGEAVDLLDDDGDVQLFRAKLFAGREVHGSGCTLSAAIAANMARGEELMSAVERAKKYLTELISNAPAIGHGAPPLFTPRS